MADWCTAFSEHFETLRPLLVEVVGEITPTYPTHISAIRLHVVERGDRFAGIPFDDDDLCVASQWLTIDDIQLWQLDPERVAAYCAEINPVPVRARATARVIGGFKTIILPSGKKMSLVRKLKRRTFIRLAADWCHNNDTNEFYAEDLFEDHNLQMKAAGRTNKVFKTDRVFDDLFRTQQDEFLELFEPLDKSSGHYRLKVTFERSD